MTFTGLYVKETPEPFPLPTQASIIKAAAGWAHCVAVTGKIDFLILFGEKRRRRRRRRRKEH